MQQSNSDQKTGVLYVVATPIGNLGDMVPRAVETLQTVNVIAAEDTRHSARLMAHFQISTPMMAYHDHSDERQTNSLVDRMLGGDSIALISDAGTPLVSDPGYRLVRAARAAGVPVSPIPGASAMIAALSAVGLPSDRFAFEGFLPAKSGTRKNALAELKDETRTLIFYEAPHRIVDSLKDMAEVFGADREMAIARELTKTFETIRSDTAANLAVWVGEDKNQQRGEIVLVVRGASPKEDLGLSVENVRVMTVLLEELSVKQASVLGAKLTGVKKKVLYQWALDQQDK
jgi:16S rRNA (cytidine1402-2'-O)-methyltransferase